MPRIELEQILASQTLTLSQDILLNWFYATFDRLPAGGGNRRINNVEPLYYQGASAGSEFLTYAATKLYICLRFYAGNTGILNAANCALAFYSEADAINFRYNSNSIMHDPVAVANRYSGNSIIVEDIYFARVVVTTFDYIVFNGYRVTLN